MKAITTYESSDGARFDDPAKCQAHEALVAAIADAMAPLGKPRRIDSHQYVQHDREACLRAKRGILALVRKQFSPDDYPVLKHPDDEIHPMSFVGRLLDDNGGPLNRAWSRFCRIDFATGREYEQPYFTKHQHEATEELK